MDVNSLVQPRIIIRAAEWICAVIAFSIAASLYYSNGDISFLIFVGVTAALLDTFFLLYYIFEAKLPPGVQSFTPIFEFFVTIVMIILWVISSSLIVSRNYESKVKAAAAFGYISLILWAVSLFLSFRRGGIKFQASTSAQV